MYKKLKLHWLFNRSVALFLLSLIGLMGVAMMINVVGIQITGTMGNWRNWLAHHSYYFLIWRIVLYTLVIMGWLWAKRRLTARELRHYPQSHITLKQRFLRIEVATVIAFIVLELSNGIGR
ncbi:MULTISPECIES: hypothetical protein [unclassified Gilliamella]|uniref:hypothetical protein n=1 Tax=unclassified Gilliamella TaxID=2685620 RepID=UPI00226A1859|nr:MULTISPECIES: hypothetical protein [unclassified Gilliamella]MCX8588478.1 hypothetical protein [Gilliamella sp. B3801]MCX8592807.1 hypothetical protein [Gilliamella sp. B3804]